MSQYLIKGASVVNEGIIKTQDVLLKNGRIEKVADSISSDPSITEINAEGKYLMPGVIDDQVHFREPGLTAKADIYTESRAAVAGGITTFMEMPNTVPNTLTQELLQDKYDRAAQVSLANYSFFMGASNNNLQEVLKTDAKTVCGIKVFMGSSTGNMLVDNEVTLEHLFSECPMLIATHCEDEATIRANIATAKEQYGENVPIEMHPVIRNAEACYLSSSMAVGLAKKHGTRLHILHISTQKELALFSNDIPLEKKKITAEACVHHLTFNDSMYATKGNFLKWNPAVKTEQDRKAIFNAMLDGTIDVIATDHAPHTFEEKQNTYFKAPSGGPLVQHALPAMLQHFHNGSISMEKLVEKMCHAPAKCLGVEERGYIREGYRADVVLIDPNDPWTVTKDNLLYKCGWSVFEGTEFRSRITHTFVNGHLAYENGKLNDAQLGERVMFKG